MREASVALAGPRGAVGLWLALTHSMWAVLVVVGFVTALALVYVQAYARLAHCDYRCRMLEQEEGELRARQRELLADLDVAREVGRVRDRAEALHLVRRSDDAVRQVVVNVETGREAVVPGSANGPAPESSEREIALARRPLSGLSLPTGL